MSHMLYVCWSTCGNKSKGVKHNEMVYFGYSFVYMGYRRLSECEGASAKERIPGYALKRGPPITAAGVGAVVWNSDGRARRHWEAG